MVEMTWEDGLDVIVEEQAIEDADEEEDNQEGDGAMCENEEEFIDDEHGAKAVEEGGTEADETLAGECGEIIGQGNCDHGGGDVEDGVVVEPGEECGAQICSECGEDRPDQVDCWCSTEAETEATLAEEDEDQKAGQTDVQAPISLVERCITGRTKIKPHKEEDDGATDKVPEEDTSCEDACEGWVWKDDSWC